MDFEMFSVRPTAEGTHCAEILQKGASKKGMCVYPNIGRLSDEIKSTLGKIEDPQFGAVENLLNTQDWNQIRPYTAIGKIREYGEQTPQGLLALGLVLTSTRAGICRLLHAVTRESVDMSAVIGHIIREKLQKKEIQKRDWDGIDALVAKDDAFTQQFLLNVGFHFMEPPYEDGHDAASRLFWHNEKKGQKVWQP